MTRLASTVDMGASRQLRTWVPHFHDSSGGRFQRQEEEAWTDLTSNTLDEIERELMALKVNKEGKGGKCGKGGKGFQGN